MQHDDPNPAPDPAAVLRREVLTLYGFAAFFVLGLIALGIDAVMSYA